MITTNFWDAIQLTFALGFLAQFIVLYVLQQSFVVTPSGQTLVVLDDPLRLLIQDIAAIALNVVLTSWLAVNWHRFILLQEYPKSFLPIWRTRLVISYAIRTVQLGAIFIGVVLVGSIFAGVLGHLLHPIVTIVSLIAVVAAVIWLTYRIGLVMPAVAVELPLDFADSWDRTAPLSRDVLIVGILTALISLGALHMVSLIAATGWTSVILRALVGWFMVLFGISCLTTLYGVAVENRTLRET